MTWHPNGPTAAATSPPIDLTAATSPVLSFWAWDHTEGGTFDGWNLKVSINGGQAFTDVADAWRKTLEDGADLHLGTWHGKAVALGVLKQHVMREEERRVVAELDMAVALARDLMPAGVTIRRGLREIRRVLLAGAMSPAVATMNAVHLLAHVTGVNASR